MSVGLVAASGSSDVVDLVRAIAWPVAVIIAAIVLRDPLAKLLARTARVSAFNVSIDLATATEFTEPSWDLGQVADVRKPSPAPPMSSAPEALLPQLSDPTQVDYAVIDLGEGQEWLTSRLYLFVMLLQLFRGLRWVVFVETVAGLRRQFIAAADPTDVCTALARRYPRLERAFATAYAKPGAVAPYVDAYQLSYQTSEVVTEYLSVPQTATSAEPRNDWIALGESGIWGYAKWLTGARLERVLANVLNQSSVAYSPDGARRDQVAEVIRRSGPFVAVVDRGRFRELIDREAVLEQAAVQALEASELR
jgi:hypothetical protein